MAEAAPKRALDERANRRRLLDRYLRDVGDGAAPDRILPQPITGPVVLSHAQERLWFAQQFEPGRSTYNELATVKFSGPLDLRVFRGCVARIVERHAVLRAAFVEVDGQPRQIAATGIAARVAYVDLRLVGPEQCDTVEARIRRQISTAPFDLRKGPLLRPALLGRTGHEYEFLVAAHHIIFDLWSARVFLRELSTLYASWADGGRSVLPKLPIQYTDYSSWERQQSESAAIGEALDTIGARLKHLPMLSLPARRMTAGAGPVKSLRHRLPLHDSDALRTLAALQRTTVANVMLGAFQALLCRYTGQADFGIGLPVANRNRHDVQDLIGPFVNTVVVRADLTGDPTFERLLARTCDGVQEALSFQHVPYEKVVQHLRPESRDGSNGLFRVVWAFQNVPDAEWGCRSLRLTQTLNVESAFTLFDLEARAWDDAGGIHLHFLYNADRFDAWQMEGLLAHFVSLLGGIAQGDAKRRLSELTLATDVELQRRAAWNRTTRYWRGPRIVHLAFEKVVERCPDAVALVFSGEHLSYAELNRHANQCAHYLRLLGAGPGVRVALCVDRGPELIAGILGILKAGAAYVPVEAHSPPARVSSMLENANAAILLTTTALLAAMPASCVHEVCLDRDWRQMAQLPVDDPAPLAAPNSVAYVMFTSGSTGRPKGVMVTHEGICNLAAAQTEAFDIRESTSVLQFASPSFDAMTSEWTTALLSGARLVLAPREDLRPGRELLDILEKNAIEVVTLPPSVLAALPESPLSSLRTLVVAGEAASADLIRRWKEQRVVINAYGPTESTVCATLAAVAGGDDVPIGRAIANVQVHVLDHAGGAVPAGGLGELYVGGAGVAQGYVNDPALTAERMVPDPFGPPGARMYRTGDRVFLRSDGQLEFRGRIDRQFKWRGYRIEPNEIEAALCAHPDVLDCSVLLREENAPLRLIAYIRPASTWWTDGDLRRHLQERLPSYMIPSAFVVVDEWPLTPNGKLDRAALPLPEHAAVTASDEAPRTPVEEIVCGIWQETLGCGRIGRQSNFFELGGHSLLATQVVARIRTALGVDLPLRVLFDSPTIAGVAAGVEAERAGPAHLDAPPILPVKRDHPLPLSFSQQRLWFLDQLEPDSALYNCHAAVRLRGDLDSKALRTALTGIVARHEILRTVLPSADGQPVQVIAPPRPLPLPIVDVSELCERQLPFARRLSRAEATRPFDLAHGPLLRAVLLRLGPADHVLLLTLHHIVSDGWSVDILIREMTTLYENAVAGLPARLATLPVQYADFAHWQRTWLDGDSFQAKLRYWTTQLADAAVLALPTDCNRPPIASGRGDSVLWTPPQSLVIRLNQFSQREGVTRFMTLVAAFQLLLHRYSGQTDIVIGSDVAGRTHAEVENLIGFFVNQLVLRTDLGGNPTFRALLARVRNTALDAYANQEVPFERLVEALAPVRDASRSPLFQAALVLQNTPSTQLALAGIQIQAFERAHVAAKHDLTLVVNPSGDGLSGELEYAADLFDRCTMERFLEHFEIALSSVLDTPDQCISEARIISPAERSRLLHLSHYHCVTEPQGPGVTSLIAGWANVTPDAIAVVDGDAHVSYAELNRRANQLGRRLQKSAARGEATVGIVPGPQGAAVVALIACLKAGAVATPLDLSYPAARLAHMQNNAGIRVIAAAKPLGDIDVPVVIRMDEEWESIGREDPADPDILPPAGALAYVMYTSGSTGTPKGVGVSNGSLDAYVQGLIPAIGLSRHDRMLQLASWSFDVAIEEFIPVLACGGTVVLAPEGWFASGLNVSTLVERYQATAIELTTAHWRQWSSELVKPPESLRMVLAGGERMAPSDVAAWQRFGVRLIHVFGLTETAITSSIHPLDSASAIDTEREFPIGAPLGHASMYVVGANGDLAPLGVPGELYIGGPGVARGYLHLPSLTAERFVPDPWGVESGKRLYRSGDRARWRADGVLEFLGRMDAQLKIRGYRVEPAEVEQVLAGHAAVGSAVVLADEDTLGAGGLSAYVTPSSGYRRVNDGALAPRRVEIWPSHGEYPIYDDLLYHAMADDEIRNAAYRRALAEAAPGRIVVDVGTGGEAVLSRLAVECGARKVYAIEALDSAYRRAQRCIHELGLSDRITLLRGDAREVTLPERVDVCVSELIGCIGSAEGAVGILERVRRFLRPGGVFIPRGCVTRIAAVELPNDVLEQPAFEALGAEYAKRVFDAVGRTFDLRAAMRNFPRGNILSASDTFEALDFNASSKSLDRSRNAKLQIERPGWVDGFLLWIELYVGDEDVVNSLDHECAWLPLFFPVFEPGVSVRPGDSIRLVCSSELTADDIHPDYRVTGSIDRAGMPERAFSYTSHYSRQTTASSEFHRRLLNGGAPRVRESGDDLVTVAGLRRYVAERVPSYMVPQAFVTLRTMPLTLNRKIDRRALSRLPRAHVQAGAESAPRTPIETGVAGIWCELLKRDRVGIHENFFEIGGHSLLATQVVSRIRRNFGVDIPSRTVFEAPTIAELARHIVCTEAETQDEDAMLSLLAELESMPDADVRALLDASQEGV